MPNPLEFQTYGEYMADLWAQTAQNPDPRTVSRLVAAESCWLQEPDETAASAKPDLEEIDGWARKIENTKAFKRMMDSPKLDERIAGQDAEGMMMDLHNELTGRARQPPDAPERTREQTREQTRDRGVSRRPSSPER